MASAGLLALLDDIATLLDDIALLSRAAATKTVGIVGDDLALNANQLVGLASRREIPVVLAVAKGSLVNKAILVPAALAISAVIPWAVLPLLMIGGVYLCFEGLEKILHKQTHAKEHPALEAISDPVAYEKEKIKGAIRTDFILSAEIVVITLGATAEADFASRVAVLSIIAVLMTVGVYGLVAAIVRLDDLGLYMTTLKNTTSQWVGARLIAFAPKMLKGISVIGTAAMFLVGGGIMLHGLPFIGHAVEPYLPADSTLKGLAQLCIATFAGVLTGAVALIVVNAAQKIYRRFRPE